MARNSNSRTENEDMSLAEKLRFVLGQLSAREEELRAVLPPDIPFKTFHATVNQALRNNPDVLAATPMSIVNACVKAAYDGLRLDGREAALVTHNVKVSRNPDRWEVQAQYFPMVFGLIQQVLRGGEVISIEPEIIYENDEYEVHRGTNPVIHHIPLLRGDRGAPIAVYSVATLKGGYVSTVVMTEHEVLDVRAASKSGVDDKGNPKGVWKRWPGEMWKKTVLRRHRKTLPLGGRDFYDVEAREEFPEFQNERGKALPDNSPRPTRSSTRQLIEQSQGTEAGLDMGFPVSDDRDGVVIDQRQPSLKKRDMPETEKQEVKIDLPEDDAAWAAWARDVESRLAKATSLEGVNKIAEEENPRITAPSNTKDRANWVRGLITDRLAEIAADNGENEDGE